MINLDHGRKATPSRQEILKEVAKQVKASEDVIIIDKIFSKSGVSASEARAFVYKKKDEIPRDKLEKMTRRMEKKKGETASPEAPKREAAKEEGIKEEAGKEKTEEQPKEEETKVEEPKEEPVHEEKKE